MRTGAILAVLTLLLGKVVFPQRSALKTGNSDTFYFYYGLAGLGSNLGKFMPTFSIQKGRFMYAEQQSSAFGKRSRKRKRITRGSFRQGSVDSILLLIKELGDTVIYKTNPCIMSGVLSSMIIANDTDTTRFALHNTSDYTVIKILDIINGYLPYERRFSNSTQEIKTEDECWELLKEESMRQVSNPAD